MDNLYYYMSHLYMEMIAMMKRFYRHVESYTRDIMEENSDNLKRFEVKPGVYSNIDPNKLRDMRVPDFDLNR